MKQSHIIIVLAIVGIALAVLALRRNGERFEAVEMASRATRAPWATYKTSGPTGLSPKPATRGPVKKTLVIVRTYRRNTLVKQSHVFIGKGQAGKMQGAAYRKLRATSARYPTIEEFINDGLLKRANMFDGYRQLLACAQYRIEKNGMVLPQQMRTEPGLRLMVELRQAFQSMGWDFKVTVVG